MHTLYFVKLNKEVENKQEALDTAQQELDNNNFASDSNGYFGSSKADWYVIGGRWSGILSQVIVDKNKITDTQNEVKDYILNSDNKQLKKLLKERGDLMEMLYINSHFIENNKEKIMTDIDSIYMKNLGFPYFRDNYKRYGYPDDAQQITKELLTALKTDYYRDVEIFCPDEMDEIKCETLSESNIGEWLVVIDYHY